MQIVLNGQPKDLPARCTLAHLVGELGMKAERVAAELNRQIVPRERWPQTELHEGDRVELVHFVGGGI
jgi:sulfur carrier protein